MVEESQAAAAEVTKRKKGMIGALVAILLVLAAIVGAAYAMELGPFAPQSVQGEQEQTPPDGVAPSEESTETSAPVSVSLPPVDAQEVMFWEQMASADTIEELVNDEFATFELSDIRDVDGSTEIRVKAVYRDATSISGWMVMRKYGDGWFFAMITRDGHQRVTPVTGETDMVVAKAIAEGNAANQEIPVAIIGGEYALITVDKVVKGSGTAIIDVTFSGSAGTTKGQITCIKKEIAGTAHWFITGFAKQ